MTFSARELRELGARFGTGDTQLGVGDAGMLPLVRELVAANGGDVASVSVSGDPLDPWIRVTGGALPAQGWKLHITSRSTGLSTLLERVVPLLTRAGVPWKCVAAETALEALNQGEGGTSQVGKALTVYPPDDAAAVDLAVVLDHATSDLSGPPVPSDHPLRPGSCVSYRYGSFGQEEVAADGVIEDVIRAPDGTTHPDRRGTSYSAPSWVSDPFIAGAVSDPGPVEPRVVAGVLLGPTLHRSPRGAVCLGTDLATGRSVVVKRADVGAVAGASGYDATSYLANEEQVLTRLAGLAGVPELLGMHRTATAHYLVMSAAPGPTLSAAIAGSTAAARSPDLALAVATIARVADVLDDLHRRGVIHRDVKPGNVAVAMDPADTMVLDFDFAALLDDPAPPPCLGTRGYAPPQQVAGVEPTAADDVWGLGALLGFAVTGADAVASTDPFRPFARPIGALVPGVPLELERLVDDCLHLEPERRPRSAGEVSARLRQIALPRALPDFGDPSTEPAHPDALADALRRLVESLSADAVEWTAGELPAIVDALDLTVYSGAAGTMLVLAEAARFGIGDVVVAQAMARRIVGIHRSQTARDGLYHGDAGIALALYRCALVAGDDELESRGRELLAAQLSRRPELDDLTSGAAGQARFHLFAYALTGDDSHVDAATVEAGRLLQHSRVVNGRRWWEDGQGPPMLGYAHGAAGVGHVLAEVGDCTGDERFVRAGAEVMAFLADQAIVFGDDLLQRVGFPERVGGVHPAVLWCHGSAGIARALLGSSSPVGSMSLGERAARSAVRGPIGSLGPSQCHGVAGTIELALDAGKVLDDRRFAAEAGVLARVLLGFLTETERGLVCPGDQPGRWDPSYMTGQAGAVWTLLRLSTGAEHLMSRAHWQQGVVGGPEPAAR